MQLLDDHHPLLWPVSWPLVSRPPQYEPANAPAWADARWSLQQSLAMLNAEVGQITYGGQYAAVSVIFDLAGVRHCIACCEQPTVLGNLQSVAGIASLIVAAQEVDRAAGQVMLRALQSSSFVPYGQRQPHGPSFSGGGKFRNGPPPGDFPRWQWAAHGQQPYGRDHAENHGVRYDFGPEPRRDTKKEQQRRREAAQRARERARMTRVPKWAKTLGFDRVPRSLDEVKRAYRRLVKEHHPDAGGDDVSMRKIVDAWEQAQAYFQRAQTA